MMEEEGAIIAGLLVGLNVIDANFCMKGEDLDSQVFGIQLMWGFFCSFELEEFCIVEDFNQLRCKFATKCNARLI